MTAFTNPT
jgi:septal ring factor EnvC (AmiA/AmiB activator)